MAKPKPPRADRPKQSSERRTGSEKPAPVEPVAPELTADQRLSELVPGNDGEVRAFEEWAGHIQQRIEFVGKLEDKRRSAVLPQRVATLRADISRAAQKLVEAAKEMPACFGPDVLVRMGEPHVTMNLTAQKLANDEADETDFKHFCEAAEWLKDELQAARRLAQEQVRLRHRDKSPSTHARVEAAIKRYAVEQLLRDAKTVPVAPATTPPAAPSSGATSATINARMIDLLGRRPEAKDWSARQFSVALECSKGSIGTAAAWRTLMQTRKDAKAALFARSTFKDQRGKRRQSNGN